MKYREKLNKKALPPPVDLAFDWTCRRWSRTICLAQRGLYASSKKQCRVSASYTLFGVKL
jgi:hypothetical protein